MRYQNHLFSLFYFTPSNAYIEENVRERSRGYNAPHALDYKSQSLAYS